MILHSKSPRKLSAFGITATATVALAILPWSTSVFAQPQNIAVATETELDSEEQDSLRDLERIERRVEKKKQRSQKGHFRQQKEKHGEHSHLSDLDVSIDYPIDSPDLHRLIQAAIHRAVKEAHAGLKHAKSHVAKDVQVEVARSLNELSRSDWLDSMTDTLDALGSISEEEIEAITEHIEIAMEHFGVAVEKSANVFAKVVDSELEAVEEQLEAMEKEGHKSHSDLRSRALKTLEAAGLSKKEMQRVVSAVDEALEGVEAEVEVHIANESDQTIPKSVKQKGNQKANGVPSTPRRSKLKHRDEQVETILQQIKSLVKQLEEKMENETDATSTLR